VGLSLLFGKSVLALTGTFTRESVRRYELQILQVDHLQEV
jgi:hypothetical protein